MGGLEIQPGQAFKEADSFKPDEDTPFAQSHLL